MIKPFKTEKNIYTFYGAIFGFLFPLIATVIESNISYGSLTWANILKVQGENALIWIIDSAPFWLGLFARFAGIRQDNLLDRYERIIEHSFNEIYIFNAETLRFEQVNIGACKNLGYSQEELTQLTPLDIKPEYTKENFEELIKPLRIEQKPLIFFETVHKRKDGTLYPVEIRLQLMKNESPPVFVAIIDNVTEKQIAEKQATSLTKFPSENPFPVMRISSEGTFLYLNHPAKIISTKYDFQIGHQIPEPWQEKFATALSIQEQVSFEEEIDGKWLLFNIVPISNENYLNIYGLDITTEKQQDYRKTLQHDLTKVLAEARTMEKGISKILQTLADHPKWDMAFYWSVDSEPNILRSRFGAHSDRMSQEGYAIFSKQTFETRFEKGIGLPGRVWDCAKPAWITDVALDPNFPRASVAVRADVHAGFGFPIFFEEKLWGVMEVFTIDLSAPEEELIRLLEDMGSQIGQFMQRMENEMELAQSLLLTKAANINAQTAKIAAEKANQAKSEFLANMSHEIRTPLNAVLGYAQILQRNHSMDPKQKKAVKAIETSGTHLLELINDILDISKIEVGQVELNPTDFDLYDLLKGLGVIFKIQAESKNLKFSIEGLDRKPIYVRGDEGKIRQILVNLLGNAVKFTDQGEVVLQIENNKKNQFKFLVSDTGKGISSDDQAHIFEPFRQGEEGLSKGGTGLGLAISSELTDLMGGQLSLNSQVGKGSCFFYTLELCPAKKPVLSRSHRNRPVKKLSEKSRVKAMVVDDMEINRDLLSDVLLSIGVETMTAANGREAVDQVGLFEPDIIFMDMRMPVMNGEEAIQEIFKKYGKERYKIVAITASSLNHEMEKSKSLGCVDHIGKPFRIARIYNCIQNLLGVEYEYEEDTGKGQEEAEEEAPIQITELSEIRIPAKMFLNFKDALETKNITRLENELANLCQIDNGSFLKDHLDPLLESNDYDRMMDILEQVLVVGTLHD